MTETQIPKNLTEETVLSVKHWTDRLFSFRITRPPTFRFRSGEFVMIGLFIEGKPLLRAYSIASPAWDEELEFFSIKVPGGPLTSQLQQIEVGSKVLLGKKPTGTLVLDALKPGKRLYMYSTGTGIAPFISLMKDPETYERYEQVIITHTCRQTAELEYGKAQINAMPDDPLVGEEAVGKLFHYTTATQEDYIRQGRITQHINTGVLFEELDMPRLNPETDRVMICGSMEMIKDVATLVEEHGLEEGSNAKPADYVIEKAFAE
ncbi:MAG: ferredoxin--NADP reductase [Alphaproteobacteria bacterium]